MRNRHQLQPATEGFAGWAEMATPARYSGGVTAWGCQVWWRGYLANRNALIGELGGQGDASWSDEKLVAAAFRRWGASMQKHLIGEFATAVLDLSANTLVLTHDALGIVPLFYSERGQTIYFGSHLTAVAKPLSGLDLDESYIAESLSHGECYSDRTIYRDVRRLGVGRTKLYGEHGGTEHLTWRLGDLPTVRYRDPRDYEERFRELLRSAVAAAVSGRTWAELSGGLDSSTIACMANHLGVKDFETVSIVYPASTTADERRWIDIVITDKQIRGHFVDGDKHQPFSALPDRPIDEPSRLHITWPIFCEYERLLDDNGVDVLLSGFGGDQVLFGEVDYPIHAADDVRRLRFISAVREVAQWNPAAAERSLTHRVLRTAAIPALSYRRGRAIRGPRGDVRPPRCPWIHPDFLRRTGTHEGVVVAPAPRMPTVRGQAYYERIWRMASSAGQSWAQSTNTYRWRHPLLHSPLVEFMYSLPWQQQVAAEHDRTLQRRSLTGLLPEQIRNRRTKSGPDEAVSAGLRANRDMTQLLSARPLIAQRGYVDLTAWRNAVHAAQLGVVRFGPAFEAAVSLELWLQQQEHRL